ncbi:unnamed protein product [Peronospora belbahrii]|uniref:Uncharacterized protein n=1 Tax=Peronospora belbahrii TaxID=622444 RepID=A0AAU9L4N3_9STRA|nr:unnamed protein product [Peronospora belbahrii]
MVIQTTYLGTGEVQAIAGLCEDHLGKINCDWQFYCNPQKDADARSDTSVRTMDEGVDLEVLAYMAATEDCTYDKCYDATSNVSGLPLVCSNCGVSFFSLQIPDDQLDCYCSGECKWSVIMYREMVLHMFTMRRSTCPCPRTPLGSTCSSSSFYENSDEDETEEDGLASFSFRDDSIAS